MRDSSIAHIPFDQIPGFSDFDRAFQNQDQSLAPFVGQWPSKDVLLDRLNRANFDQEKRNLLVEVLTDQYRAIDQYDAQADQIMKLGEPNVFTIITAHQPVLFGGPLYLPYKIGSAINLARTISKASSDHRQVIPLFVIGGEDHDFEEISGIHVFGRPLKWSRSHGGAVGRLSNQGLAQLIDELAEVLGENATEVTNLLKASFSDHRFYAQSYQDFMIRLFGKYGLVVINMDDARFKRAFIPVMEKELLEGTSRKAVERDQSMLESAGFSKQAHAREVNFFYLTQNERSVILKEDVGYHIREINERWTQTELKHKLATEPENFSPNVIMRPIYQEYSIPNIAYVGGGGELAYWSERGRQFEDFGLSRPVLVRRCSVFQIDAHIGKKMNKYGLSSDDLWRDKHELMKDLVSRDSKAMIELESSRKKLLDEFEVLLKLLESKDGSLGQFASAEKRKLEKTLSSFESKLVRVLKRQKETQINHIDKIFEALFPSGGLQERHDNFLPYLHRYGTEYLDFLVENLDPLDRTVRLISIK